MIFNFSSPSARAAFACCVLLLASPAICQNRVPDPGFEILDDCTFGPSYSELTYWYVPSGCVSSAYFNACAPSPNEVYLGVPQNVRGYETAHGGQGYATIMTYRADMANAQIYLTTTFSPPLAAGQAYCIQFWLSLCDSSSFRTNTMHALVTSRIPTASNDGDSTWAQAAQVTFNTSDVGTDGWVLMQGSFIAQGLEQRLTLGNFLKNAAILADTTFIAYHTAPYYADYYIDDVYLGTCDVGVTEAPDPFEAAVYPDPLPRGSELGVRWGRTSGGLVWSLVDTRGLQVASGQTTIANGQAALQLGDAPSGLYLLHLETQHGQKTMTKVVLY